MVVFGLDHWKHQVPNNIVLTSIPPKRESVDIVPKNIDLSITDDKNDKNYKNYKKKLITIFFYKIIVKSTKV